MYGQYLDEDIILCYLSTRHDLSTCRRRQKGRVRVRLQGLSEFAPAEGFVPDVPQPSGRIAVLDRRFLHLERQSIGFGVVQNESHPPAIRLESGEFLKVLLADRLSHRQ